MEIRKPNTRVLSSSIDFSCIDSARGFERPSLNKDSRKRELIRIARENQAMLKRLQEKQPNYHAKKFDEEYQSNIQFLKNICEYPLVLNRKEGCQSVINSHKQQKSSERYTTLSNDKRRVSTSNKNFSSTRDEEQKLDTKRSFKTERQVLYKEKKKLTPGDYLIEIYTHNQQFIVVKAQENLYNSS